MNGKLLIGLLVVFAMLGCEKGNEKIDLRLKYIKGAKQNISYDIKTEPKTGGFIEQHIELETSVQSIAENNGENNFKLGGVITNILFDVNIPDREKYHYDPTKKIDNPTGSEKRLAEEFEGIVGTPVELVINEKGKISDLKGFERVTIHAPHFEVINFQIPFPDQKLGVNDVWEVAGETGKTIYKVKEITNNKIVVGMTLQEKQPLTGVQTTITGEFNLDAVTCQLIDGKMIGESALGDKISVSFKIKK